jgi:uncharacterized protein YjaG (DUF416 family)
MSDMPLATQAMCVALSNQIKALAERVSKLEAALEIARIEIPTQPQILEGQARIDDYTGC